MSFATFINETESGLFEREKGRQNYKNTQTTASCALLGLRAYTANFSPASKTNPLKENQIGDYMKKGSARAAIQPGLKILARLKKS